VFPGTVIGAADGRLAAAGLAAPGAAAGDADAAAAGPRLEGPAAVVGAVADGSAMAMIRLDVSYFSALRQLGSDRHAMAQQSFHSGKHRSGTQEGARGARRIRFEHLKPQSVGRECGVYLRYLLCRAPLHSRCQQSSSNAAGAGDWVARFASAAGEVVRPSMFANGSSRVGQKGGGCGLRAHMETDRMFHRPFLTCIEDWRQGPKRAGNEAGLGRGIGGGF
jgi:hypothetical protein